MRMNKALMIVAAIGALTGNAFAKSTKPPIMPVPPNLCDLNYDGKVDLTDVQNSINRALQAQSDYAYAIGVELGVRDALLGKKCVVPDSEVHIRKPSSAGPCDVNYDGRVDLGDISTANKVIEKTLKGLTRSVKVYNVIQRAALGLDCSF